GAVSLERRELKISEGIGFALDRYLQECDKYSVWLLIDDIDATYIDTPDYQSRIGAFFGALRLIVNELKGVKVRATVRSDVWTNLRKVEHLDKWEQYIVDIKWDDASMRRMLSMRILSYLKRNDLIDVSLDAVNDYKEIVELVFLRNFPWDGGVVDSFVPLKLFSAGRPRWMGQICRMSGECCANRGGARIGIDDIKEILENFGLNRVNDLMKEHSHQFPHVDKLVDIFRGNKKSYSLVELSMLLKEKGAVA
ncbi:P-loop ATPase, Sll1717 family, partial [Pseudogulbenkiania ferrooxidans]|uniref:P-loop ATPase, Sll1717 family n=1 Tax=Pseudogulbenkiania ferrooxidans TaxID=549169 RepID=UPI00190F9BB3